MVRKRLIAILTIHEGVLSRTRNFEPDYRYTQNFIDNKLIDEIVVLDITRDRSKSSENFYTTLNNIVENCFVPITVGGNIQNLEQFNEFLRRGADKVSLNTYAVKNEKLITKAAKKYGTQSVVVSIDVKRKDKQYEVFIENGKKPTGMEVIEWAKKVEQLGAGEILLTSIDKDGTLEGYDNELNGLVTKEVNIPVVISGGAGKWKDFVDGIVKGGAAGVATTNIYHFTESSIKSAKEYMLRKSIFIRKI